MIQLRQEVKDGKALLDRIRGILWYTWMPKTRATTIKDTLNRIKKNVKGKKIQNGLEKEGVFIKILVIAGDYWHPMEVIKRGIERMKLDPQKYEFDFVEDAKDIVTKELLEEQNLVIFAKSNVISEWNNTPMFKEGNAALTVADYRTYVENGGGLLSVHAGNTGALTEVPEWCEFVGSCFITHPARCDVRVYPMYDHSVTEGVEDFTEVDEQYELGNVCEDANIFLKSFSAEGGVQVAGYTREIGKGKLCVLTPGHTMNVWGNTSFVKLFVNAMEWCVR